MNVDRFIEGYLACSVWSSTDEDGKPLDDDYGVEDIAPESIGTATTECRAFIEANASDLEGLDSEQAGHDFWLTRNGHGVGFWDRGLGERGGRLSASSEVYGECYLYVGDDGLLYFS